MKLIFQKHKLVVDNLLIIVDIYKQSKKAMKQMIRAFEHAEYVVGPSGSCVGMIKQYPELFEDDPIWEDKSEKNLQIKRMN